MRATITNRRTPREVCSRGTPVPVSGLGFDASLDFWLTTGRFADTFERDLAQCLGIREAILCNSGEPSSDQVATCYAVRNAPGDFIAASADRRRIVPIWFSDWKSSLKSWMLLFQDT